MEQQSSCCFHATLFARLFHLILYDPLVSERTSMIMRSGRNQSSLTVYHASMSARETTRLRFSPTSKVVHLLAPEPSICSYPPLFHLNINPPIWLSRSAFKRGNWDWMVYVWNRQVPGGRTGSRLSIGRINF